MSGRLTVLNDDRLDALRAILQARIEAAAALVSAASFDEFFDVTMRSHLVAGLKTAGADEGTVWLLDETRSFLVPQFNNGPNASAMVGRFQQSLGSGMISMVVATEQPICENEVHRNQHQDQTLDERLGLRTCSMLAVPFYFANGLRGVISGVQLARRGEAPCETRGFSVDDLSSFQLMATVLARLIDHQLHSLALGMEDFT